MKLIIDISEEAKKHIDTFKGKFLCGDGCDMISAIQNGTPLPKGHGDLIDEKDLSLMTIHMIDGTLVCDAPTIIEADKESENEQ